MKTFYRSIRFRMAIVYMAILAVILSIFSIILYQHVSRSLYENMDTILRSKAENVVYAIGTYWEAEKLGPRRYGAKVDESYTADFATSAQKWLQEKSKDPRLLDIIVQIYDPNGTLVASSKNTQGISSVDDNTFISVLEGKSVFSTLLPSFPTKTISKFRIFITPAIKNNEVEYVVQVASPLTSIRVTLDTLKLTLFLLFPATVLLTGVMGAFLASMTLHPVNNIINTIHTITLENMKLKLKIPGTKDEIDKLAETFNDMLARLDKALTSQRQLFENLSHDLKTPLTIIKGEFEVASKKTRSPEEYKAILDSSLEEVNRIIQILDNLLVLASFESRKILPEMKNIDLNSLVQDIVNRVKKIALSKMINLNFIEFKGAFVKGDEEQLKQVFLNLIDNAIKYTHSGGRVTVRFSENKSNIEVIIKDSGIGMSGEQMSHVFDRFYRADKSRTKDGFGLGLSIVKSIVEAHGGSVRVSSKINSGSIFTVSLPAIEH